MPHVSSKRVKKNVFNRMTNEFVNTVSGLKTQREIKTFLNELLTPTERIMLAKRLAVIMMLKKGYPFHIIEKTLKISSSTSMRFWKLTKIREFSIIMKNIQKEKAKKKFWNEIEVLMRASMPPMGRGRWIHIFRSDK